MAQEIYEIDVDSLSYSVEEVECDVDYLSYDVDSCMSSNLDIELLPGKSAYEIAIKYGFTGTEQEWLDSLKANVIKYNTKEYWQAHPEIIPSNGELVVITNYSKDSQGRNCPAIKVGDGVKNVANLANMSGTEVANKLAHSITIGNKVFDGSSNVVVDVYDGETSDTLQTSQLNSSGISRMSLVDYNVNDYLPESNNMSLESENLQMGIVSEVQTMSISN